MLDLPFMQPANPSARVPSAGDKNTVDDTKADAAVTEFEAEYEDAGPDADTNSEVEDATGEAAREQSSEADEGEPPEQVAVKSDAELDEPDFSLPDGAKSEPMEEDGEIKRQSLDTTTDSKQKSLPSEAADTVAQQIKTNETGITLNKGRETDASVTTGQATQRAGGQGTTAENVVLASSVKAKANATTAPRTETKGTPVQDQPASAPAKLVSPATAAQEIAKTPAAQGLAAVTSANSEQVDPPRRLRSRRDQADISAPPAPRPVVQKPPMQTTPVSVAASLVQSRTSGANEKADVILSPVGDLDAAPFEQRGTTPAGSAQLAQAVARTETPTLIARQMAEALQRSADRPVEIALNPKELGRVRMSISAAEAGVTVSVIAERPETLDLMRRNIEQLAREFEVMGYSDIGFAFAEGEAQQGFAQDESDSGERGNTYLDLEGPEITEHSHTPEMSPVTGVDIRL